jgi:hypothetical protein
MPLGHFSNDRRRNTLLIPALALLSLAACAPFQRGPAAVTLAQLAAKQEDYDGRQVRTNGQVHKLQDVRGPFYYVLEDTDQHDVELQPAETAARYEERSVTVTGEFHFTERTGRSITIQTIDAGR